MTGPLTSLRILDFSTLLPGPFATMMLGDMGADIIRIEAPNRPDILRETPPMVGQHSAAHATLNRNKRSLALNLKHPDAPTLIQKLVQTHDIVVEQFRPGVMDRLGVGYTVLEEANPHLIYCAITGYGQTGPFRDRAGHDNNYLALSGLMSHSGRMDTGPYPQGTQIADIGGGSYGAVVAILGAVIHRLHTGEGQFLDVSMLDGAIAWNALAGANFLGGGELPTYESWMLNGGTHYGYYRTADGRYLSVSALEPQFWQGFCKAIGRPDFIPRYTHAGPAMRQVRDEIAAVILTKTMVEWMAIFEPLDVCVEPVLNLAEMTEHPQIHAREMIIEVPNENGTLPQIAHPIKYSATPPKYRFSGAELGQHTAQILGEMGYTNTEIEQMQTDGLFG
ncbi:MAG: CoA transferase [Anaerolineae bacterium]|nr:CoA transferase [Anaerolineae bacterium]